VTDRHDLRRQLRAYRRTLSAADRLRAAEAVAARLQEIPALAEARSVAGYWAVDGELPLHEIAAMILRRGQRYCLPALAKGQRLRFLTWAQGEPLEPNRFGIPEPVAGEEVGAEALDAVLVPLLAFDDAGNRLGSGAGYYDRTFAFRRAAGRQRPLLIGVGYAFQHRPSLPAAEWDVPLDLACTEEALYDCSASRTGLTQPPDPS
jgi:5-formyltetrahydrofolate cyclo-ligase